jgi:hypothetical protein
MAYVSQEMKKELAPGIKAVLKKYNIKVSIGVRHHSTLVVNIQSGAIDFSGNYTHGDNYIQVNEYWIDDHYAKNTTARDFLNELVAAMKGPNYFNDDDAMTDYFCRSHYTDINVGKWNKPYVYQPKAAKTIKVPKNIKTKFTAVSTVEDLARMNQDQRSIFVQELVERFPNLGDSLMTSIGFELMSKEAN